MRAPSLIPPLFIFDALAFGHGLDGEAVVLRALSVCIVILNNVKNILLPRRVYQNIYTFAIVIPVSLILGKPYYYLFMETTALNPTQMHLLKLFAFNNSEEYAREVQKVLTRHFQSRLDAEADRLWDEGILDQDKLDEIRKMDLHSK